MPREHALGALILSAGSIKDKFWFGKYIYSSPGLIPVNCKSLLANIVEFYMDNDVHCYVVVNEEDLCFLEKELLYYRENITYLPVANTKGVVGSIQKALPVLGFLDDIVINVVTTIPTVFPKLSQVLVDEELKKPMQWSALSEIDGQLEFYYKTGAYSQKLNAFTGVFRCSYETLRAVVEHYLSDQNDLLVVVEAVNSLEPLSVVPCKWIDCGHEVHYYDSRMQLISSRSFNSINVIPGPGLIYKSSSNKDKFEDEVRYVTMLPKEVSIYFPRYFEFGAAESGAVSAIMEFYGYPALAEYMLYWQLKEYHWDKVYENVFQILATFKKYRYSIGKKAFLNFYFERAKSRINMFLDCYDDEDQKIYKEDVVINGDTCRPISMIMKDIYEILDGIYCENHFCIMHGDLCFNNILYDLGTGVIRLIDARGSFGEDCKGIYGDQKYDIAKFSHSTIGYYDYIVNSLFSLSIEGANVNYSINLRPDAQMHYENTAKLIDRLSFDLEEIKFLVGLIFVSIAALHKEDKKRQNLLYFHGLSMLNKSIEKMKR